MSSSIEFCSADTRYGSILVIKEDDLVSKFLIEYGEWAHLEVLFLAQYRKCVDVVFDVGAYLGTFSLAAAGMMQPDKIVAIEANPAIMPALRCNLNKNLALNNAVVEGAVCRFHQKDSLVNQFYYTTKNVGSLNLIDQPEKKIKLKQGVRINAAYTLRELRNFYGDYDFIKLDAEGMELDILQSDQKWIIENKPALWLECNESKKSLELLEFLVWANMDVYYYAWPAFNEANYNAETNNLYPFAYEAGLFVPNKLKSPILNEKLMESGAFLCRVKDKEGLRRAMWETPRWGKEEWSKYNRRELIALLSRYYKGEHFRTFLG
jgi:FkbM family methyltransferase